MSTRALRLRSGPLELERGRPAIMGVVNASPESFSDGGQVGDLEAQVARAERLVEEGAAIIDIGGESGVTDLPAVAEQEEIERVVPLIERVAATGVAVSVDTWKPAVAKAAIAAGAGIVNDVSGLRDPELARVCGETGTALVITHTRAEPKSKEFPDYPDVGADVVRFLRERIALALERRRGRGRRSCSTRGRTWPRRPPRRSRCCAGCRRWSRSATRCSWPSRARTSWERSPGARRMSGWGEPWRRWGRGLRPALRSCGCTTWREVADFLRVRAALRGQTGVPEDLELPEHLRRHRG